MECFSLPGLCGGFSADLRKLSQRPRKKTKALREESSLLIRGEDLSLLSPL